MIKKLPIRSPTGGILRQMETTLIAHVRSSTLQKLAKLSCGYLEIKEPDSRGTVFGCPQEQLTDLKTLRSPWPCATLSIKDRRFWRRVLLSGDIGFAQSYMMGEIECSDLCSFFEIFILNQEAFSHGNSVLSSLFAGLCSLVRRAVGSINDAVQSRLNVAAHYSLSNEMFAAFLSPYMTYSAPVWLEPAGPIHDPADPLEEAQRRKLQLVISQARIQASDHVLEIGTGWGSFAILAVQMTGCRVTTITLSAEQKRLAEDRIKLQGLSDKIKVLLCDYRQVPLPPIDRASGLEGYYDKIVSIEMVEHVGPHHLDTFFSCVNRYLTPRSHGIVVVQSTTIPENRYKQYAKGEDFIQKYIFPGGHLPTASGLISAMNKGTEGQLVVEEIQSLGKHYGKVLATWRANFLANFEKAIVPALRKTYPNMTEEDVMAFKRKWEYYFSYSEAGFRTKTLGNVLITAAREGCLALGV